MEQRDLPFFYKSVLHKACFAKRGEYEYIKILSPVLSAINRESDIGKHLSSAYYIFHQYILFDFSSYYIRP